MELIEHEHARQTTLDRTFHGKVPLESIFVPPEQLNVPKVMFFTPHTVSRARTTDQH